MPYACSACGHQNPDDARFCQSCGSPLSPAERSTRYEPTDHYRSYNNDGYSGYDSYNAPSSAPTSVLVWSILATVFCCQLTGIVAIVFAALAMSADGAGNRALASRHAATAKTWAWVSFGLGLAFIGIYVVIVMLGTMAGP
jgi:hypothetical protein